MADLQILPILARVTSVTLSIWLIVRAVRNSHKLGRHASILRWTMVSVSATVIFTDLRVRGLIPEMAILGAIFVFVVFLFLPDLSYYLVEGFRRFARRD